MGTMFVHVCNGCHTEKGLYITHKSILMKHQTNKQTYSATINIGKNINYLYKYMYISVITHCMLKRRRLTTLNVIHVTINASVDFLKSMPMTIQLKTICQLYKAIVQGKLQYKYFFFLKRSFSINFWWSIKGFIELYLLGDKMRIRAEREILTKFV